YIFENPIGTSNMVLDGQVDAALADGLRGSMRIAPLTWVGGVATGAQLIKPQNGSAYAGGTIANPAGETWGFSVWGIDGTGAVVAGSKRTYAMPHAFTVPGAPIVDNAPGASGINPATGANYVLPNTAEFDNYRGTAAFRGPVSQIALGSDLAGNKYVAATVYNPPFVGQRNAPGNAIVVGKISTASTP